MAVNLGVAFGEGANGGQVVFLELVGQEAEPPAEQHHVGGGEGEREFLRRRDSYRPQRRDWLPGCIRSTVYVSATPSGEAVWM